MFDSQHLENWSHQLSHSLSLQKKTKKKPTQAGSAFCTEKAVSSKWADIVNKGKTNKQTKSVKLFWNMKYASHKKVLS